MKRYKIYWRVNKSDEILVDANTKTEALLKAREEMYDRTVADNVFFDEPMELNMRTYKLTLEVGADTKVMTIKHWEEDWEVFWFEAVKFFDSPKVKILSVKEKE